MVKKLLLLSFALGIGVFALHDLYGAAASPAAKKFIGAHEEEKKGKAQQQLTEEQTLELGKTLEQTKLPSELLHLVGEYTAERDSYEYYTSVMLPQPKTKQDVLEPVSGISFSPDGQYMALCLNKGSIDLYDMTSKRHVRSFSVQGRAPFAWFSPDGSSLAYMTRVHKMGEPSATVINILNYKNNQKSATLKYTGDIERLKYNADGSALLFISLSGGVFRWTSKNGVWEKSSTEIMSNTKEVVTAIFSSDNRYVAMSEFYGGAGPTGSMVTWYDMRTNGVNFASIVTEGLYLASLLSFSFDNRFLAFGYKNGSAYIFLKDMSKADVPPVRIDVDDHVEVTNICFSPNQLFFAATLKNGVTKLWRRNEESALGWEHFETLPSKKGFDAARGFAGNVFSPDGKFLAVVLEHGVEIWRKNELVKEALEQAERAPLKKKLREGMNARERLDWLANKPSFYRQAADELIKEGKLNAVQHRCATLRAITTLNNGNDKEVKKRLKKAYPEYCK